MATQKLKLDLTSDPESMLSEEQVESFLQDVAAW